jgi:spore coat polysaccharide biosynthesis protein SpsF
VLKELPYGSGITVLQQVIRRLKRASLLNSVIVVTTLHNTDDEIVDIAPREGVASFRGSERDVLSRYYYAAKDNALDVVVRVTSDCPCMDPEIVDMVVDRHMGGNADYTSNTLNRTFPRGLDVEVFSFDAMQVAFNETDEEADREHVTPYLYKSGKFRVQNVESTAKVPRPDMRITLDTREDYTLLCAVFDFLYDESPFFGEGEIIGLFEQKPWLRRINEHVEQKKIFDNLKDELKEAVHMLNSMDLKRARDFIKELLDKGI